MLIAEAPVRQLARFFDMMQGQIAQILADDLATRDATDEEKELSKQKFLGSYPVTPEEFAVYDGQLLQKPRGCLL